MLINQNLVVTAVLLLGSISTPTISCAELGEDGLHKQPWFSLTFKDVAEDLVDAHAAGKRLAIIVEQQGCIYCKRMHERVFSDPQVSQYISENFLVVQYNLFGDEEVTDLDGEVMAERDAAIKWGVMFTPTILFLPATDAADTSVAELAEAALPGAFGKWTTLHMFQYVYEQAGKTGEHFQRYHARKLREAREAGELSNDT